MSILKTLHDFIINFDLFGVPINLFIKRKEVYQSAFGTLFSLFIIGITLQSFTIMVEERLSMKNPNIISKVEYTPSPKVNIMNTYF